MMCVVVPVLGGDTNIPNEEDVIFAEFTDGSIPRPVPDCFDRAWLGNIKKCLPNKLTLTIIPTGYA